MKNISPIALYDRMQAGETINLIDVRTPSEYSEVHIVGARLYPITQFEPGVFLHELTGMGSSGKTIFVVCRGGVRSQRACEMLHAAGHIDVVNVEGGTDAWSKAGLPVVHGKTAVSLERQTHLALGFILLLMMLLGFFINTWFYLIPLAVGFGLIYAGLSGDCMLTRLLANMVWNR